MNFESFSLRETRLIQPSRINSITYSVKRISGSYLHKQELNFHLYIRNLLVFYVFSSMSES